MFRLHDAACVTALAGRENRASRQQCPTRFVPTVEGEWLLKFIDPQQPESGVSLNETPNLPFDESR